MTAQIVGMNGELDVTPGDAQGNGLESALVTGATQDPKPTVEDNSVPEKYQDKTAAELVEILSNQETLMGRQSTELGDLRNQNQSLRGSVDQALALQRPVDIAPEPVEDPVTDRDFALDPVEATRRMIQGETKSVRAGQDDLNAQARALAFENRHSSAAADLKDPAFIQFVKDSPSRSALASRAFGDMSQPDFDSADQLWDLYSDYKSFQPADTSVTTDPGNVDTSEPAAVAPAKEAPAMVTGTSGGSAAPASDTNAGKDKYSQTALNDLQTRNPDQFWSDAVQKPLAIARAEGRVVDDT
jgi:hypothetical protein